LEVEGLERRKLNQNEAQFLKTIRVNLWKRKVELTGSLDHAKSSVLWVGVQMKFF